MPNMRNRRSAKKKYKFLRNMAMFFNFLVMLIGVALLVMGTLTIATRNHYTNLLSNPAYAIVILLFLVTGAVVVLLAVIGCVGVAKQIRTCLLVFSVFLVLLCVAEAVAGVLAYTFQTTISEELHREFNTTMLTSYKVDIDKTQSIDLLQTTFKCCGSDTYTDWQAADWIMTNGTANKVPDSCCVTPQEDCGIRDHPSNIHTKGCVSHLIDFIKEHLVEIGAIAFSAALVQILAVVFACCFARSIRHEELEDVYHQSLRLMSMRSQ